MPRSFGSPTGEPGHRVKSPAQGLAQDGPCQDLAWSHTSHSSLDQYRTARASSSSWPGANPCLVPGHTHGNSTLAVARV